METTNLREAEAEVAITWAVKEVEAVDLKMLEAEKVEKLKAEAKVVEVEANEFTASSTQIRGRHLRV